MNPQPAAPRAIPVVVALMAVPSAVASVVHGGPPNGFMDALARVTMVALPVALAWCVARRHPAIWWTLRGMGLIGALPGVAFIVLRRAPGFEVFDVVVGLGFLAWGALLFFLSTRRSVRAWFGVESPSAQAPRGSET